MQHTVQTDSVSRLTESTEVKEMRHPFRPVPSVGDSAAHQSVAGSGAPDTMSHSSHKYRPDTLPYVSPPTTDPTNGIQPAEEVLM